MTNKQENETEILNRLTEIFYLTQYGKLMPGFIHNINGKLTSLDSKIQLTHMKLQMKLKKLKQHTVAYSEEVQTLLEDEYNGLLTMFDALNASKNELNALLAVLNSKASNENIHAVTMIDINNSIREFDDFFKFYKRYKHNITVEFDLEDSPFAKMQYNDFYFLLYAVVRNAVDATAEKNSKENIIRYTTRNFDSFVELYIYNNGVPIAENSDVFAPLNTHKAAFGNEDISVDTPMGAGLDLYFLQRMLAKYPEFKYSWQSDQSGTTFKFVIPKK